MDYSLNIGIKTEKDDLDRDSNDNIQELLFDVQIKVENEVETTEDTDWSVTNLENCGDLLVPLFFKQVMEPLLLKCVLCYRYFEDQNTIFKHNLTHLKVTVVNPKVFQCDCCLSYFTDRRSVKQHIFKHNQINSRTVNLSYKPKSYNHALKDDIEPKFNVTSNLKTYTPKHITKMDPNLKEDKTEFTLRTKTKDGMTNMLKYKPKSRNIDCEKHSIANMDPKDKTDLRLTRLKDGMTNSLKYKPKSCNTNCDSNFKDIETNTSEGRNKTKKTHQCNICKKTYTYTNWHAHMQEVHGNGGFFCGLCKIEFKCERYFMRHMKNKHTHTDKSDCPNGAKRNEVKCDECDTILLSLNALRTHKRNVHSGERHICHICNSKLKCKSYLLTHMRRVHYNDGKKHYCECGKSFRSPRYLSVHKRNAHLKK